MISKIEFFPKKPVNRECGDCYACCTGPLDVDVPGYKVRRGNPCPHIKEHKCGIYEDRPIACKEYICHWIDHPDLPDWMQPHKSGVILTDKYHAGFYYIMMSEVNNTVDPVILNHVIQYIFNTGRNLEYTVNQQIYHLGSPEFMQMVQKELINKV